MATVDGGLYLRHVDVSVHNTSGPAVDPLFMVASGGGHPQGFWDAAVIRGDDPVAPGATTEYTIRPTRYTTAPGRGQWWLVEAYTTSPNALSTSTLQQWRLGSSSTDAHTVAMTPPHGQQDGHPDQERGHEAEERLTDDQLPAVLVELVVPSRGHAQQRRPHQHPGAEGRPQGPSGRPVRGEGQPEQDGHRPDEVVLPRDGGDQHPGGGADQDAQERRRPPVGPGGERDPGDQHDAFGRRHQRYRHDPVVEPVDRPAQALVADEEHLAHPLGVGGVLRE